MLHYSISYSPVQTKLQVFHLFYYTCIVPKSIQQTKSKQGCIVIFRALQCINNHLQEWLICQYLLLWGSTRWSTSQKQWWCSTTLYSKDTNHITTIIVTPTINLNKTRMLYNKKFCHFIIVQNKLLIRKDNILPTWWPNVIINKKIIAHRKKTHIQWYLS